MNRDRRKMLNQAVLLINQAYRIVDNARDQEQDCLDNMPENLEYSYRYEKMEEAVDNLTDAVSGIEEVLEKIGDAVA